MSSNNSDFKNFMGSFWVQNNDGIVTLGLNEEALADFDEVLSFDLPSEQDQVELEEICGSIDTSDGPLDIYSPVSGTVIEVNSAVVEDPAILFDDPTGEGWILKFSAEADFEDEDEEDDEEDDDFDDDDEDEDYEDED